MVEALDASVRLIYEPIGPELRRVADNLSVLADGAGLSGDDRLVAHAVVSGGKKVRPALTLLASKVYGGDPAKPITMATAVELLHIATLIHDDTVDRAETRRGRATVSNEWGGKVAVLLGDYVFATSAIYVCDTEDIYVIRRFSETIMELARGELAEHFSAFDWAQTVADYERRIMTRPRHCSPPLQSPVACSAVRRQRRVRRSRPMGTTWAWPFRSWTTYSTSKGPRRN